MSDLVSMMLQWTFSLAGLVHLIGVGILASAAIRFGRNRSVGRFCLVGLGLWAAASALGAKDSYTPRAVLAGAIWALSTIAVYTGVLAVLVAKGKRPRPIIVSSVVLFLIQAPLSLLSGLYLTCYVGHDCP